MARSEENRLIARAKRGHADAFRSLVEAYQDRLFTFIYRITRNHHEAEDVCQSAFVRAFESLKNYNEQYAFSTWLFTIGYRLCLNNLRKKKASSSEADFADVESSQAGAPTMVANTEEARRLRDTIWTAVDDLTESQRSAVLLFYRENLSCQEIGDVMGVPAVTVKSHLHRAREKLRKTLSGSLTGDWTDVNFFGDAETA